MEEPQHLTTTGRDRSAQTAETLRTLREQADQTLASHRRRLTNIESELNLHVQQIAEELARDRVADDIEITASQELQEELQHRQETLSQVEEELAGLRRQLTEGDTQRAEHTLQFAEQTAEFERLTQQCQEDQGERAQLVQELEQLQEALTQVKGEADLLHAQIASLSSEHGVQLAERAENLEQSQRQIQETEVERERLANALEQLEDHHRQTQSALEVAEANNKKAAVLLRDAEQKISELSSNEEAEEQLQQMRRKFELALADVHKFKRENSELHEELLRRPETDEQESPELVNLRSERDALAARVVELESAPPEESNSNVQQEMADLQRRFEMAVEDVRALKQENADLNEQIKEAQVTKPEVPEGEGLDWKSQKARLLAALDAEDRGILAPERGKERTTIQETISITERVVAKKDQELAHLQQLLEAKPAEEPQPATRQAAHEEAFDQDEVIQAERARLEQVRQELQGKLREAELDLSVQRATLARKQAALETKLARIQKENAEEEEAESSGKPRRRWLAALGLKDEEDE